MSFTGWEVRIEKLCPRSTAEGGTQTEGTVSPNTDRPRLVTSNLCVLK